VISVLIVDDHSVVREGIRRVIETEMNMKVCAEASSGREVSDLVGEHRPDVVILDINMPHVSGLESLNELRSKHPKTKVIFLSIRSDTPVLRSAVHLGADGFLLKNAPVEKIIEAIRAVHDGGNYFSPEIQRFIIQEARNPGQKESEPFSDLSNRELEVLGLIAKGKSSKEIASELHISTKTVEAHRTNLMRKLDVRKSTELVRYAIRHGLIEA
jgi:two-component system response regulator DegU